jgi:hypothetical protein
LGGRPVHDGGRTLRNEPQYGDDLGEVFRETGRCAAKPRGGSTSPLEKHADFFLALIELEPGLTLDEDFGVMRELNGQRPAPPQGR